MANSLRFGHLLTAVVTPFGEDHTVDFDALQKFAAWQFDKGADSLVVCGTTGESPTLTQADKLDMFRAVKEVAQGRGKVIANVGSNCTRSSIQLAVEAQKTGVDGLMAVTPYYNKPPQEGIYQHFRAIAEAVDLPLMVYNIPGRCVVNIEPDTIIRLTHDCDNIACLKQAVEGFEQTKKILAEAREDFEVFSGNDEQTLEMMRLGGSGVVSTISNVTPDRMSRLCNAVAAGNLEKAQAEHDALLPLMGALFKTSNPILVKEALKMIGFDMGGVRLPLVNATPAQSAALAAVMKEVGVLS